MAHATDHDPTTCQQCARSVEPWAQAELRLPRRPVRRFTGWAALVLMYGPPFLVGFVVGFLVTAIIVSFGGGAR